MRDIFYTPSKILYLGQQKENEARRVVFPLDGLEAYTPIIIFQRNDSEIPYPVEKTEVEDGNLMWTLTDTDTGLSGYGKMQIDFRLGDEVMKSVVISTYIADSLDSGDSPTPEESWLDQMLAVGESARQSAERAEQAAEDAEQIIATDSEAESYFEVTNGN